MKLSIVIVNYNVCSFLEQCLRSVQRSQGVDCRREVEVWVVDNASVDDSVAMVKSRFPWVRCIENRENVGFAKANNQAIAQAGGDYVLLLNPDTVLEENTLAVCLAFMDAHPEAGGLGVRMLDGNGRFLPESKRGLPTPETAFYKMAGLARLFPHSKRFARYYMGHLSEFKTWEVEVLSGAFMLMPKRVLDEVGYLDETFFMYGEDIDLSYRITQGGYKNYYLADTRIIHYKGESTKKGSLNYVRVFYKAMEIFVAKHFKGTLGGLYAFLLKGAIWLRASVSVGKRLLRRAFLPLWDLLWAYGLLVGLSYGWGRLAFGDWHYYGDVYRHYILWVYAAILVAGGLLAGAYRNPIRFRRTMAGYGLGLALLFGFFALAGPQWQFSRFMLVAGSAACALTAWGWRYFWQWCLPTWWVLGNGRRRKYLLVGRPEETEPARRWLSAKGVSDKQIGRMVWPMGERQLCDRIRIDRVSEVVFCSQDVPFSDMVRWMEACRSAGAEYSGFSESGGKVAGQKI